MKYWLRPWSFLPNSQVHIFISLRTTPRSPGIEAVELGIGTNGLASFLGGKDPER
jgi:hypothetical protein